METIVRLQEIELIHFKNVAKGVVRFPTCSKRRTQSQLTDILGVYGQNGSGKTALIEALTVLQTALKGEPLSEHTVHLIQSGRKIAILKFTFLIKHDTKQWILNYHFEIKAGEKKAYFYQERISFQEKQDEKATDMVEREHRLQKDGTSFFFSEEGKNVRNDAYQDQKELLWLLDQLTFYAAYNLYIIQKEFLGIIHMHQFLPIQFRLDEDDQIVSGDLSVSLFETTLIHGQVYPILVKIVEQINVVLKTIIPELAIEIQHKEQKESDDKQERKAIEMMTVNGDVRIPLKYESDGIKKVISILSAMAAMYNSEAVCLVVDELDASIFEYLLGEIVGVLQDGAKGQFLFTSHNLRIMEKLRKESIILTTTNPANRYVRLSKVKRNHNLRDFYLRAIVLGGQKEYIYEGTNSFEIAYAFRKARDANEE